MTDALRTALESAARKNAQLRTLGRPRWCGECPNCGEEGFLVGGPSPTPIGCNACGAEYHGPPLEPLTRAALDALHLAKRAAFIERQTGCSPAAALVRAQTGWKTAGERRVS